MFLNFGGITNIDFDGKGWDIGYCNMLSNLYANKFGLEYDGEGKLGEAGNVDPHLLKIMEKDEKLNTISMEKSFGREDF